jgi:phage terminase small subunit
VVLFVALNDKEICFATEYIINKGNAYQAALSAGYSKSTAKHAYQWLEETQLNPTINRKLPFKSELKKHIDDQIKQMESKRVADATEVMQYLTSVMRGESKAEVVVTEFCGDGVSEARTMEKHPDEKEKLKAAESLAKILGISKEKIDLSATQVVIVDDVPEDW